MQPQVSGKVGSLVGWLVGSLVGWLVGWFFGWLVGWLVLWLVGWLVGCWVLGGPRSAFPMTVEFYRKASCCGRNKNADENARKIPLLKRQDESVRISFA